MKNVDYGNYKSDTQCFYSGYIVIISNNNLPLSIIIMMILCVPVKSVCAIIQPKWELVCAIVQGECCFGEILVNL